MPSRPLYCFHLLRRDVPGWRAHQYCAGRMLRRSAERWDATAGTYQIALSAYENLSFAENLGTETLADGFTGLGNLYPGEDLHYAFDVNITPGSTPPAPVPEPASGVLRTLATGAFAMFRRKRS